jgi:hypothetical protein
MKHIKLYEEFITKTNELNEKVDLKLSTTKYDKGVTDNYRLMSDIVNLRKISNLSREAWARTSNAYDDNELGFKSADDRKVAMTSIQNAFNKGDFDIKEFTL